MATAQELNAQADALMARIISGEQHPDPEVRAAAMVRGDELVRQFAAARDSGRPADDVARLRLAMLEQRLISGRKNVTVTLFKHRG